MAAQAPHHEDGEAAHGDWVFSSRQLLEIDAEPTYPERGPPEAHHLRPRHRALVISSCAAFSKVPGPRPLSAAKGHGLRGERPRNEKGLEAHAA